MKEIISTVRNIMLGGLFFLAPVVLFLIVIAKIFKILQVVLHPVLRRFPDARLAGLALHEVIAVLILLLLCFCVGLLAATKRAKQFIQWLEQIVLGHIPGYKVLKSIGNRMAGLEEEKIKVVLARVDDGWQLSFLIEQLDDNLYTVFVPSTPSPWSGSLYHLEKDRIKWTNITKKEALNCISQMGIGSAKLLKANF